MLDRLLDIIIRCCRRWELGWVSVWVWVLVLVRREVLVRVLARVRRRAVRVGIWVVDSKLDCEWFPMFFLGMGGCADRDSFSSLLFLHIDRWSL